MVARLSMRQRRASWGAVRRHTLPLLPRVRSLLLLLPLLEPPLLLELPPLLVLSSLLLPGASASAPAGQVVAVSGRQSACAEGGETTRQGNTLHAAAASATLWAQTALLPVTAS